MAAFNVIFHLAHTFVNMPPHTHSQHSEYPTTDQASWPKENPFPSGAERVAGWDRNRLASILPTRIVKFTGGYIVITERSHRATRRAGGPNPQPKRLDLWANSGVVVRNFS